MCHILTTQLTGDLCNNWRLASNPHAVQMTVLLCKAPTSYSWCLTPRSSSRFGGSCPGSVAGPGPTCVAGRCDCAGAQEPGRAGLTPEGAHRARQPWALLAERPRRLAQGRGAWAHVQ